MGYESRVYVVRKYSCSEHAETLAMVNMCKMGYGNGWTELFTKDIDYKLFADDGNTEFDTDMYGDHLKSCPIDRVIAWLEGRMEDDTYRRLSVLHGLLTGFDLSQWDDLEVVHYGY